MCALAAEAPRANANAAWRRALNGLRRCCTRAACGPAPSTYAKSAAPPHKGPPAPPGRKDEPAAWAAPRGATAGATPPPPRRSSVAPPAQIARAGALASAPSDKVPPAPENPSRMCSTRASRAAAPGTTRSATATRWHASPSLGQPTALSRTRAPPPDKSPQCLEMLDNFSAAASSPGSLSPRAKSSTLDTTIASASASRERDAAFGSTSLAECHAMQ